MIFVIPILFTFSNTGNLLIQYIRIPLNNNTDAVVLDIIGKAIIPSIIHKIDAVVIDRFANKYPPKEANPKKKGVYVYA